MKMKRKSFRAYAVAAIAAFGLVTAMVSCSSDDVAENNKKPTTESEDDANLTTFTMDVPETRASYDDNSRSFFWESGDHIWVKDDNNQWKQSSNAPSSKTASFKFKVPGKFTNSSKYWVYYAGKYGSKDQVRIPDEQVQTDPKVTTYFDENGDCGMAEAEKQSGTGYFKFSLVHQPAVLVFAPWSDKTLKNDRVRIIKIVIESDDAIAGTCTLDPNTKSLSSGDRNTITLKANDNAHGGTGFAMSQLSNMNINGMFALIKPGTHNMNTTFYLKDLDTSVEYKYTKTYNSWTSEPGTRYTMDSQIKIEKEYPTNKYYMWGASADYWGGNSRQPTYDGGNYGNGPSSGSRYMNTNKKSGDLTTGRWNNIPNANEMAAYVKYGDPHWDADKVWVLGGHLHKSGMWFKKMDVLLSENGYNRSQAKLMDFNGVDLRTTIDPVYNYSISYGEPSNKSDYFFLPSMGGYSYGTMQQSAQGGGYWSSSTVPGRPSKAYNLGFDASHASIDNYERYFGLIATPFGYGDLEFQ